MKKVLVVCGNGIELSSIMLTALKDYLDEQNFSVDLDKASLMTGTDDFFNDKDLIVSSTKFDRQGVKTPVIVGSALLTGIGEDDVLEKIKEVILS